MDMNQTSNCDICRKSPTHQTFATSYSFIGYTNTVEVHEAIDKVATREPNSLLSP